MLRRPPPCAAAAPADSAAVEQQLEQQLDQLSQQLQALKAQLDQLKAQNQTLSQQQQQTQQQVVQQQAAQEQVAQACRPRSARRARGSSLFDNLSLWGYGEVYYTRPIHEPDRSEADLARAVFGIGYRFDERTVFNSEYEVEHAVASATDAGEFEVEQFYINHQLADWATVRGGLFLMPFGLLNEHHEPTNFYGVQRTFVETLIIPSTWREGGFNFHGDTDIGIGWNVGLTTGQDLSKWNYAPEFPQYITALDMEDNDVAPLQASHQELALANAGHLSEYLALSYTGVPGLTAGAAVFTGNAGKVPAPPNAPIPGDERVTLWEAHARWTPGKFDLSALYARGSITNLSVANASNPGSPNPIPSAFYGYYVQGAYNAVRQNRTPTASPRSCAGRSTAWARPTSARPARWCRKAWCRSRPTPATTATGRSTTIASGPPAPTSTSRRMWC